MGCTVIAVPTLIMDISRQILPHLDRTSILPSSVLHLAPLEWWSTSAQGHTMPHLVSLIGSTVLLGSLATLSVAPTHAVPLGRHHQNRAATSIASSTTGPLAKQLQGKPVVVDIYASWCPACRNIAPTLSGLRQQYANRVHFVVLDVSDKAKVEASMATAQKLGLAAFFAANKTQTGLVAIIDPSTGKIITQHRNNATASAYTSVLNKALAK
jgi:thiol-disulfide isomerase/thioredoxin